MYNNIISIPLVWDLDISSFGLDTISDRIMIDFKNNSSKFKSLKNIFDKIILNKADEFLDRAAGEFLYNEYKTNSRLLIEKIEELSEDFANEILEENPDLIDSFADIFIRIIESTEFNTKLFYTENVPSTFKVLKDSQFLDDLIPLLIKILAKYLINKIWSYYISSNN